MSCALVPERFRFVKLPIVFTLPCPLTVVVLPASAAFSVTLPEAFTSSALPVAVSVADASVVKAPVYTVTGPLLEAAPVMDIPAVLPALPSCRPLLVTARLPIG